MTGVGGYYPRATSSSSLNMMDCHYLDFCCEVSFALEIKFGLNADGVKSIIGLVRDEVSLTAPSGSRECLEQLCRDMKNERGKGCQLDVSLVAAVLVFPYTIEANWNGAGLGGYGLITANSAAICGVSEVVPSHPPTV
jgi:hypothetical protein